MLVVISPAKNVRLVKSAPVPSILKKNGSFAPSHIRTNP